MGSKQATRRGVSDLARWVYSRCIPLGFVLKVNLIPCYVGPRLLEGELHLWDDLTLQGLGGQS